MANNQQGQQAINEITEAFDNLNEVVKKVIGTWKEFTKTASPSGFVKNVEKASQAQNNLNDAMNNGKKGVDRITASYRQQVPTLKQLVNQKAREERLLKKSEGLYNKVQRGVNAVSLRYKELAIRKELDGKLNAEQIVELGKLEAKLNKYQNALKNVDAKMGNHQRNVGNYKSGFDSLGFSVAQITRESPAFINSMQTGFMAISNNIPSLVDEINKLRAANIGLAKEGKPTVNVLKRVGAAIFSWQSLISGAIVALTVFGPKLFNLGEDVNYLNDALKESKDFISDEMSALDTLLDVANDTSLSYQDRQKAIEQINDKYPEYLKNIDLENLGTEDSNALIEKQAKFINALGIVKAAQAQKQKMYVKLLELERATIQESTKWYDDFWMAVTGQRVMSSGVYQRASANRQKNIDEIKKEIEELDAFMKKKMEEGGLDVDDLFGSLTGGSGANERKERIEGLEAEAEGVSSLLLEMQNQVKFLEKIKALYAEGTKEANFYAESIRNIKIAIGEITADELINVDEAISGAEEFLSRTFGSNSGKADDEDKLGWQTYFNTLVPLAQNTFDIIAQLQRAASQQALADLEKQKDLAIKFAGESSSAREAIEEQYNERRAEIQRKQAEAEKRQAIFSTTLNVATAVVNALTAKPFSLPLSIAVGAIGAAQLALIASQPIPEFADGVRDFGGGLAVVGDGGRSEVVRTKDGKVFKTPSTDTLVNLPKGSDVFSSESEFEKELNMMLGNNNIFASLGRNESLISKPELTKEDLSDVIGRLEDTIRSKESIEIIDDEKGRRVYQRRMNTRTELLNNRRRIKSKGV